MLGDSWLRFDDAQQRRLASRAKALGRRTLAKLGCILTPDTLLRWYRKLIARKYDGSRRRGRPRTRTTLANMILHVAHVSRARSCQRVVLHGLSARGKHPRPSSQRARNAADFPQTSVDERV